MNPLRRTVLSALGVLPFAADPCGLLAQVSVPDEGIEYQVLSPPVKTDGKSRIEVIEFFWYGCPHCYAFEPIIEPWVKRQPFDVRFGRIPAVFHDPWVVHAKLYYSLEMLGQAERLHAAIFDAIHREQQPLDTEAAIGAFLEKHGIARRAFANTFNSFGVQSRVLQSRRYQEAYKFDGVPAMGVDGKYLTANTMMKDGRHESVLPVLDYLILRARQQRKATLTAHA